MADLDIDGLQSFTDAEILKIYRYALSTGGFRTTYTIGGRSLGVPGPEDCMKVIEMMERRTNSSSSVTGTLTALAKFGNQS